ncbi:hypothetical protein CCR75_009615 [Bremia lactucae]|uniref:Uncharacterized protein n=1 Tax=Bremia lactucae TaxID=4779 RepID=A0A976FHV7_BRELC|nr:hypothetical protein CCR75_009615 [Bremia lactucae]
MDPKKPPKTVDVPGCYPMATGQPFQVDAYGRPIVTAMPVSHGNVPTTIHTRPVPNNSNIRRDAQGNALCNKCSAPYPLPGGCTSWRCRNCAEFNNASIYGNEWCNIL